MNDEKSRAIYLALALSVAIVSLERVGFSTPDLLQDIVANVIVFKYLT